MVPFPSSHRRRPRCRHLHPISRYEKMEPRFTTCLRVTATSRIQITGLSARQLELFYSLPPSLSLSLYLFERETGPLVPAWKLKLALGIAICYEITLWTLMRACNMWQLSPCRWSSRHWAEIEMEMKLELELEMQKQHKTQNLCLVSSIFTAHLYFCQIYKLFYEYYDRTMAADLRCRSFELIN